MSKKRWTVERLKAEVRRMDENLSDDDPAFATAVLLLSLLMVERPTVQALVEFTGFERAFVAERVARLRQNGVLVGWGDRAKMRANWFEEHGGYEFWLDVCVADGYLEKS